MQNESLPMEQTLSRILTIRGQRVIIDADLAQLYGVPTKRLNEQVRRNRAKFPGDFLFALTKNDKDELVANCDRFGRLKHSTALPFAFTEHGAVMVATVLNSPRAVGISVLVVRAFVLMRDMLNVHRELAAKVEELESKVGEHDETIHALIQATQELIRPEVKGDKRPIGFRPGKEE
jgi:hypothetical protein